MLNKSVILVSALFLLIGCTAREPDFKTRVNLSLFEYFGSVFLLDVKEVTAKDIHLAAGTLDVGLLILRGEIVSVDKFYTSLVVSDKTGRILAILTDIDDIDEKLSKKATGPISLLGQLDQGKKGLPFLKVKSIYVESSDL